MYRALEQQRYQLGRVCFQYAPVAAQLGSKYLFSSAPAFAEPVPTPVQVPNTPAPPPVEQPLSDLSKSLPVAQIPLRTGRPRLVVLGTGWAGASLLHNINPKQYDITVVSPRNHMVFTPLLASTTVGTLEFRSVVMPVMDIQKALHQPQNKFFLANALQVLPQAKRVVCKSEDGALFNVEYDKLALCTGSQGSTFNIPGVHKYTHFLRDVSHALAIREHLIKNVGAANIPGRTLLERQRLLHVVVVGGGPTGVEFSGELSDLINQDLKRKIPARAQDIRVTLIEAAELLNTFDKPLREYAARRLTSMGVRLVQGVVKEVREKEIELRDGRIFPFGVCVWSTGVGPTPFIDSLPFVKCARGRIMVDSNLNVSLPKEFSQEKFDQGAYKELDSSKVEHEILKDVFALGDCSANDQKPLPPLAQVAEQQGHYLGKQMNELAKNNFEENFKPKSFQYNHLGSMATVGNYKAVFQLGSDKVVSITGFFSWVAWRSAYLTRLASMHKRMRVAVDWTTTILFGRDLSRW